MAPLRASLARSPPRLGRSQAGGLHPQTPRAAPPGARSRTGPLLPLSPSRKGSGHGCARWPGWSTACGCPRWTPSPSSPPGFSFSKRWAVQSAAGGSGGRAPRCSGAVGNACAGGGRSGVNAQRCPRRPRAAALSTAERATGRGVWKSFRENMHFPKGTPESCISGGAEISAHFV